MARIKSLKLAIPCRAARAQPKSRHGLPINPTIPRARRRYGGWSRWRSRSKTSGSDVVALNGRPQLPFMTRKCLVSSRPITGLTGFQIDRPSRGSKTALTEIAACLVKNADVMKATAARDKMANVPSSTSAISPRMIHARGARSTGRAAIREAELLTFTLPVGSNCGRSSGCGAMPFAPLLAAAFTIPITPCNKSVSFK